MAKESNLITLAVMSLFINLFVTIGIIALAHAPNDVTSMGSIPTDLRDEIMGTTTELKGQHQTCDGNTTECLEGMTVSGSEDAYSLSWADRILNFAGFFTKIGRFAKMVLLTEYTLSTQIKTENVLFNWGVGIILWIWQIIIFIGIAEFIFTRLKS